ncbi:MAG TPA: DUF4832 domain-containing protein [Candidatus Obscuribacterales bacterium]
MLRTESPVTTTRRTGVRLVASAGVFALLLLPAMLAAPAGAKPQAVELLQYLSPLPEKTYLNESQDRIIKKKSFKVGDLPDAPPVINRETGFFVLLTPEQLNKPESWDEMLSRPDVNGLSVLIPWRVLEPAEEQYNWKPVDDLLDALKKRNKSLILRVSTCGMDLDGQSDTPAWVFDSGVKKISYSGADGKSYTMPIFWDTNYLAKWNNFIQDLGERYDKNPAIHSIGITGGGVRGGTAVIPCSVKEAAADADRTEEAKNACARLEETLKKEHGLSQRQIVEHWKYVADLFPQAFPTARLNFNIDAPIRGRAGQDALDEISDYLLYRYGQRIYVTRQNVRNAKHGFDQYRVLLKFHPDTLTGYQLAPEIKAEDLEKLSQNALVDGISFAEIPYALLTSDNQAVKRSFQHLLAHIGYQIVSQKVTIPAEIKPGEPLKASFTFTNLGAAAPMRPMRAFDKDVASSYKIQLELRDSSGKPVVLSLHTPSVPTHQWPAGKPVSWDEELKMPQGAEALKPGEYSVWLSIVDADTKRKLSFLNAMNGSKPAVEASAPVGTVKVLGTAQTLGSSSPASQ